MLLRDRAADGLFYYAVTSTGIYCRPTCPSRRPRRENVCFFDTTAAAEQAGFRPCQRCQPGSISAEQQLVAQVQHLLEAAEGSLTLQELGEATGTSPYHLQRLFKRATGMSPKQYAAALHADRLKAELKKRATVTEAMYEAGYGSARALYDQASRRLGMTPGAYRRGGEGERVRYAFVGSPTGKLLIAVTDKGVCALRSGEETELLRELAAEFPRALLVHDPAAGDAVAGFEGPEPKGPWETRWVWWYSHR